MKPLWIALLACTLLSSVPAQARPRHPATVTGTYRRDKSGILNVQALPGGRIRFHLSAMVHPNAPGGPNSGDASGVVPLRHNVAVYKSSPGKGRLTMRFARQRVTVVQSGTDADLGFGAGVDAAGVYTQTSRLLPKFDEGN